MFYPLDMLYHVVEILLDLDIVYYLDTYIYISNKYLPSHTSSEYAYAVPDVCRQMPRYLRESQLKLLNHTSFVLSECGQGNYWLSSVNAFSRIIPAMNLLPPEQGETWIKQMQQSHENGTFFCSGTFFTFYVTRE